MNLSHPPMQDSPIDNNKVSNAWGQWFSNLFLTIGGNTGAGVFFVTARIDDIHTASTIYVLIPRAGRVVSVTSCIQVAITGSNETITIKNSAGSTLGTLTITSTETAGAANTLAPTTNNLITANSYLKITSAGTSSTACPCWLTVGIQYT